MQKLTVRDVQFADKRVLVRVDFNVPLAGTAVSDDTRIRAAIPTIKYILDQRPRAIILMSHLGRPKGARIGEMSLAPVVPVLSQLVGKQVAFCDDCIGTSPQFAIEELEKSGIILLENTRFHVGETRNDPEFARQLSQHGDIFINDAFGTAHRAHASNVGVSAHLTAVAGLLLEREINYLATAINDARRPFMAILGGAKVSGKIDVIAALVSKVDKLLIGGGMANTFFAAQGRNMADSLVESDALDLASELLDTAGGKIMLPIDQRIASDFANGADTKVLSASDDVPDGWQSLDIGPETVVAFARALDNAKTIVWNGPMGVFEMPSFANGTVGVARALADQTAKGAITIIGGGDSAAAVEQAGLAESMSHISTGGGASLELLEGKVLPGLAALTDK